MCEMWRVHDSHVMKETPAPPHPGTQHPLAPQIKNPRMCIMQKMLPNSKGWDSSPFARAPASEGLKIFTVQVPAGVLPPSRRARGPSPLKPPSSLLEAPSHGPLSLPLQGGFEEWNEVYNWLVQDNAAASKASLHTQTKRLVHNHQLCQDLWILVLMPALLYKILFSVNKHIACNKCQQVSTHCTLIAFSYKDAIYTLHARYSQWKGETYNVVQNCPNQTVAKSNSPPGRSFGKRGFVHYFIVSER